MNLNQCHNFQDFRKLARKRLPSPIFNYIDGAADDEVTYQRNTKSYEEVDLIPVRRKPQYPLGFFERYC